MKTLEGRGWWQTFLSWSAGQAFIWMKGSMGELRSLSLSAIFIPLCWRCFFVSILQKSDLKFSEVVKFPPLELPAVFSSVWKAAKLHCWQTIDIFIMLKWLPPLIPCAVLRCSPSSSLSSVRHFHMTEHYFLSHSYPQVEQIKQITVFITELHTHTLSDQKT